jgi:ParB family chromosome partitioning protein
MTEQYTGSIFWIEVSKIKPNPFQPRHEFDEDKLRLLADSIRQYGVLQPLVVTRQETFDEDGNMTVQYELIAGERRWRASKLAGILQVPALIKTGEDNDKLKLEMAIIENLQREDLNAVDRARAFQQFGLKHSEVAKRVGKSREYVSNSIRIMALPELMLEALVAGKISEGHTRPLLMLADRLEEQETLFREIMAKRLTVREAESNARRIAYDRVRKHERLVEPEMIEVEQKLTERLGTRVKIERKEIGGKVTIDFMSNDDLNSIVTFLDQAQAALVAPPDPTEEERKIQAALEEIAALPGGQPERLVGTGQDDADDLYDLKNFSL